MILDTLKNCGKYYGINEKIGMAFDFIKRAVAENLPVGNYEIDGRDVYSYIQEYTTKSERTGGFESHKKYIDIQFIASGVEVIDVMDISKGVISQEYNETSDAAFYKTDNRTTRCLIEAGQYAIFLPDDLHKPGIGYEEVPGDVKKIVVKVKI
ncbi:MAG: YhcH/YjgK/YiaL family protein [Oscillospiraceae bacterium]|nr:YhcH/YjgK/YiaL family protein [Oscillospiraceae bacterium]